MNTQSQRQRLRWKKKPFPELVRLAGPIAVSLLSYSVMTLIDTLFVGRLGASALAAVGLGGIAAFTILCFGFSVFRGGKALIAQAMGAGRPELVPRYVGGSLVLVLVLGAVSLGVAQLLAPALPALAASPRAGALSELYFGIRIGAAPFALLASALREARYGVGDSRSPMRVAVTANLTNIPLNALLIFGFELGVAGAAWASVAAQVLEALLLVIVQREHGYGLGAWRRRDVVELWRIGAPVGVERLLDVGSFTVLVALLARMGERDLAAHYVAVQVWHFSVLPAFAVSEAASVLAGQAVGAREDALVLRAGKSAIRLAVGYMLFCSAVYLLAGPFIVRAFGADSEVQRTACRLLWVAAAFEPFHGLYMASRGTLRGAGDVRFAAVATVATAWICTPPLTALLGLYLGLGALGAWLALCVEVIVGAAVLFWRLARGGWLPAAEHCRQRLARDALPAMPRAPALPQRAR